MTINTDQLSQIADGKGDVLTSAGDKIGSIGQVYVDDTTGEPSWVTVKTGLFGTSESFVPLEGANVRGSDVLVNYDKDTVKDAPRVDADGALSPDEEETLYSHYGLSSSGSGYADAGTAGVDSATGSGYGTGNDVVTEQSAGTTTSAQDDSTTGYDTQYDANVAAGTSADIGSTTGTDRTNDHGTQGHDTSGPTTDDAMTLSEERLRVGKETRESGRARLKKYVTTQNVTETVPLRHEEVTLEREPITDANVGAANSGPAISEEEHEVVLHEERPVVDKDVVATERVRLGTKTVTENETVSGEVRKENIDTDIDTDRDAH